MYFQEKKYFFVRVKNFPQEIENTREIIKNMSEIIQNISDIFFATYTPADFQVLGGCPFLSAKPSGKAMRILFVYNINPYLCNRFYNSGYF